MGETPPPPYGGGSGVSLMFDHSQYQLFLRGSTGSDTASVTTIINIGQVSNRPRGGGINDQSQVSTVHVSLQFASRNNDKQYFLYAYPSIQ